MSRIVISYRREDSAAYAGRLYDRLVADIGKQHVFMDIDTIPPGEDFVDVIEAALANADVLLAIIGPRWTDATDTHGQRRLTNPMDFVRLEVQTALNRQIRVVPVLVGEAQMPSEAQLPDALGALARRNTIKITDTRFHADVDELITFLKDFLASPSATPPTGEPHEAVVLQVLPDPQEPKTLRDVVRVVEASRAHTPFAVDAIALEEDTSFVLSADIAIRDSKQHPIRLMTELYEDQPKTPGAIIVKQGEVSRLLAIVHDFNQEPSSREEWIQACLTRIFEECAQRHFVALGLEFLGTKHGAWSREDFERLFDASLHAAAPSTLRRIWLSEPD